MTESAQRLSPKAVRFLRLAGAAAGVLLALAAVAGDIVAGGGGFGRIQLLLLVTGVALVVAAAMGRRAGAAWRTLALVLLNTLALFIVAELGAGLVLQLLPRPPAAGSDWRAQYERAAYFDSMPSAAEFWREHWRAADATLYEPFTLWRSAPYTGRFVNVSRDGLRQTTGGSCDPGAYRIYLFGGSTMWGWLAGDAGTIPSLLSATLARRYPDRRFCVVNHGQLGYVSTQERVALERLLEAGDRPDLALFYGGWNDCDIAASNLRAGLHKDHRRFAAGVNAFNTAAPAASLGAPGLAPVARRLSLVRLAQRGRRGAPLAEPPVPADSAALAGPVAAGWESHARMVDALATRFGFSYRVMLQPWIRAGAKPLSADEERIVPAGSSPVCRAAYERMGRAVAGLPRSVDLRPAFDTVPATLYLDEMHVTPAGNAIIARLMADAIGTELQ